MINSIAAGRLVNQQLSVSHRKNCGDLVSWMGAIQAQDFNMAEWAVGIRIPGSTEKGIRDAFNRGEILRTHVLRPTWHFVAPENIRWMLSLSSEKIKASSRSRDRDLEISEALYTQTNRMIQKALEGNKHLTREALGDVLEKAGIAVNPARLVHFLMRAEVEGIVCSGVLEGKKQTYALLDERVPFVSPLPREEASAKLARIYFGSHGPATLSDFVWWSGLGVTEAKAGLDAVKSDFIAEKTDGQTYWMPDSFASAGKMSAPALLLPAFDEYIISYRDRKAVLDLENHGKAVSSNGVFRPTILFKGQVVGLWKKTNTKSRLVVPDYFSPPEEDAEKEVKAAVESFKAFTEM